MKNRKNMKKKKETERKKNTKKKATEEGYLLMRCVRKEV